MEGESMRAAFEKWFVKYKVDLVFAGRVHAYERSVSSSLQQSFLPFDFFSHGRNSEFSLDCEFVPSELNQISEC